MLDARIDAVLAYDRLQAIDLLDCEIPQPTYTHVCTGCMTGTHEECCGMCDCPCTGHTHSAGELYAFE